VKYFENINISREQGYLQIPEFYYAVYQNIIAINHFKNEAYIFDHNYNSESNLLEIEQLLKVKNFATYNFSRKDDVVSNLTDEEFKENVRNGKKHCQRGDVIQLVLSRRFSPAFKGDDFKVYRAYRTVTP